MRKVFLTGSCKTAEMVQRTRDTFFSSILGEAQNHSHSARAHSHPDSHLRAVLPGQVSILTSHLLFSISGIWGLWMLFLKFTINTIGWEASHRACWLSLTSLLRKQLRSPSPSSLSSSYSQFCIHIGLMILSTKVEGNPDGYTEMELPTIHNLSVWGGQLTQVLVRWSIEKKSP